MKLIALEMPDDPANLPAWLERRLIGLELAPLVAELEAIHRKTLTAADASVELDTVLGTRREAVLREGLKALPRDALRTLLTRPRLLLDLQELALTAGGEHWQRLVETSEDLQTPAETSRRRLAAVLPAPTGNDPARLPFSRVSTLSRRLWLAGGLAAAAVLAGVILWPRTTATPVAAAGWGWSRPGALPQDGTPSAYLNRLADAAGEWFAKRPDDRAALEKRIREFRQGCDVLIAAEHRPLSLRDTQWLREKCRAWAGKLDAHLADVRSNKDAATVRDETDATIRQLITALRQRAKEA